MLTFRKKYNTILVRNKERDIGMSFLETLKEIRKENRKVTREMDKTSRMLASHK